MPAEYVSGLAIEETRVWLHKLVDQLCNEATDLQVESTASVQPSMLPGVSGVEVTGEYELTVRWWTR